MALMSVDDWRRQWPQMLSAVALALVMLLLLVKRRTQIARSLLLRLLLVLLANKLDFVFRIRVRLVVLGRSQDPWVGPRVLRFVAEVRLRILGLAGLRLVPRVISLLGRLSRQQSIVGGTTAALHHIRFVMLHLYRSIDKNSKIAQILSI